MCAVSDSEVVSSDGLISGENGDHLQNLRGSFSDDDNGHIEFAKSHC